MDSEHSAAYSGAGEAITSPRLKPGASPLPNPPISVKKTVTVKPDVAIVTWYPETPYNPDLGWGMVGHPIPERWGLLMSNGVEADVCVQFPEGIDPADWEDRKVYVDGLKVLGLVENGNSASAN